MMLGQRVKLSPLWFPKDPGCNGHQILDAPGRCGLTDPCWERSLTEGSAFVLQEFM